MDLNLPASLASPSIDPRVHQLDRKEPELRSTPRLRSVFLVAYVETRNDRGLARIRNISDQGVGLRLHLPATPGDTMIVHFTEDAMFTGTVIWRSGPDCGLQLDQPIDSQELLRNLATQGRSVAKRALRMPLNKSAVARSEKGICRVEIQDISQSGMRILHDGSLAKGMQVQITPASGNARRGVVRWSKAKVAGLLLLEQFSADELGSISQF